MTPIENEAVYLCDLAQQLDFISESESNECLKMQRNGIESHKPRRIGRYLLEYGFITEPQYVTLIKKYKTFKQLEGIREEVITESS